MILITPLTRRCFRLCARLGLLFLVGFLVDNRVWRLCFTMVKFKQLVLDFATLCRASNLALGMSLFRQQI